MSDPGGSDERSALDTLADEQLTAREHLIHQRTEAVGRRGRLTAWLVLFGFGPGALAAIALAMLSGRPDLIWPFVGLGAGVQIWRIWKEQRRIRSLEKALLDPIDGS